MIEMAPPRKKRLVLLVDIGAIGHASNRSRFVSVVTASKIVASLHLHKKTDEVVVVFIGSSETRNRLYDEENNDDEDDEDKYYANVEVLGELKVHSSMEYSKEVEDRAREFDEDEEEDVTKTKNKTKENKKYEHRGDILDALTIACDILAQRMEAMQGKTAKIANEILLLSPCAEDALGEGSLDENEFARDLVRVMKEKEITLSVGVGIVDSGGKEEGEEQQKRIGDTSTNTNTNEPKVKVVKLLAEMVKQTNGQIEPAMDAIIGRLMRTKTPTTTFRGNLSFGKLGKESYLSIPIWAYKQTMEATAETMKPYGAFEGQDLLRDVQYKNISKIDGDEIPAEQRVRCYKYGKQSIPMDESVERQFGAEKMKKGVEIIGTVDLKYVPFWLTTEEPMMFCAWPELTEDEKVEKEDVGNDFYANKVDCNLREEFAQLLFQNDYNGSDPNYLNIYFPQRKRFLVKQTGLTIIPTIILTGLLIGIFVYAYFTQTWSLRQSSFASVMIGAGTKNGTEGDNTYAKLTAKLMDISAHSANQGLRAYYFSLAALTWFYHPLAFITSCIIVLSVLYRREFNSTTARLLIKAKTHLPEI